MKQRSFVLAALAVVPFTAAIGQVIPATPPLPPDPVVTPVTPARPLTVTIPDVYIDRDAIRRMTDDAMREADFARIDGQRIASEARAEAQMAIDAARMSGTGVHLSGQIDAEAMRSAMLSAKPIMASVPFEFDGRGFASFNSHVEIGPPPSFMQGDPADSIYQTAREAFNRQDYSRAAGRFGDLLAKYPNSRLASQAAYYQAFSLYRVGTLESLRTALKVLETNSTKFEYDQRKSDAPALQARILRALSDRNEPGVDAKLKDLYAKYPSTSCDEDANQIKAQVLSSLYQSDPNAAMPYIKQHLATRDACNADLRRSAVLILGNRPSEDMTSLIVQVAKTDTVRSVRTTAIQVLSRMPGDAAINALQELMKDSDEQVQGAAVRSLMRNDSPKARTAMRTLIDRSDASERQRLEAIQSYDRDNTTTEDAAYLRSLYGRANESERIKDAVISALARTPSQENVAFLLNIAKNPNESSSLRAAALRRISRSTLSVDDLSKLYDASDSRSMRQSLVDALGSRTEDAAVNKLLDIVRFSTDPEVRSNAIQVLLRKKDDKITQRVLDLISKGKA